MALQEPFCPLPPDPPPEPPLLEPPLPPEPPVEELEVCDDGPPPHAIRNTSNPNKTIARVDFVKRGPQGVIFSEVGGSTT